jgi:hypothetical protein
VLFVALGKFWYNLAIFVEDGLVNIYVDVGRIGIVAETSLVRKHREGIGARIVDFGAGIKHITEVEYIGALEIAITVEVAVNN